MKSSQLIFKKLMTTSLTNREIIMVGNKKKTFQISGSRREENFIRDQKQKSGTRDEFNYMKLGNNITQFRAKLVDN